MPEGDDMERRRARDTNSQRRNDVFLQFDPVRCYIPRWRPCPKSGYPQVALGAGRMMSAHRAVGMLLFGPLKSHDEVLHRCGNRWCCDPNHLYVAGNAENRRDCYLHAAVRAAAGLIRAPADVPTHGDIFMPQPIALSREKSRFPKFSGFTESQCFDADWLPSTYDGFRQLIETVERQASGSIVGAHRVIFQLFVGKIDKYDVISHTCGNNWCLNPFHLRHVGREDEEDYNFRNDPRYTVSPEARRKAAIPVFLIAALARVYGVHPNTLGEIRRNALRSWNWELGRSSSFGAVHVCDLGHLLPSEILASTC